MTFRTRFSSLSLVKFLIVVYTGLEKVVLWTFVSDVLNYFS